MSKKKTLLPLYKDKPRDKYIIYSKNNNYNSAPLSYLLHNSRLKMVLKRGFLGLIAILSVYKIWTLLNSSFSWNGQSNNAIPTKKDQVEQVFLDTWADYKEFGWGYDIYSPVTHKHSNMPKSKDPLGWIIVDSIDTLMLMYNSTTSNKARLLQEIREVEAWVANELTYDIDAEINIFETTIRMLGGLLSAYYYSSSLHIGKPNIYLNKAVDLANRLMPAFQRTSSGIPYSSINLHTGNVIKNHVDNGASSTAEFTTLQMEFKYLSYLTGNSLYWEAAEKVYKPLYENNELLEKYDGLVPIYTQPDTGIFHGKNIRLGSRGDSFYEYLLKQYLLTHETLYYDLYRKSMEGVKKHLVSKSKPNGLVYIGEKEHGLNGPLSPKMDHLVCFMGGLLAMGATEGLSISDAHRQPFWDSDRKTDWKLAEDLTQSCYQMYHQIPSGLAPEIVVFNDGEVNSNGFWESPNGDFFVKPLDRHNLQRPETVESIMILYHLTKDQKYRDWGWEIFENFREHTSINCDDDDNCAYTSLKDVISIPTAKADNVESFWLAETLKYLYLLFEDDVDLTSIVFNTEAHPFPVLDTDVLKSKQLFTGWSL